ncbi:MAG: proton-conducting transporter membrane subunit [Bacteroidia bacterium]|nr:hypothetical protein [Bacteroidia bacterium]MDW8015316.1 proton-conducting transporter membrane subunit [Bacteroidia bacterium]
MILWWIASAFIGALAVLLFPKRWVWQVATLFSLGMGGWILYEYLLRAPLEVTHGLSTLQFRLAWWGFPTSEGWTARYSIQLFFATDGTALWLALAVSLICLILSFWPGWMLSQPRLQMAAFLSLQGLTLWTIFAYDLISFYVGFEAVLLPTYYLILTLSGGSAEGRRTALEFLLYTLFGSVPMLGGILYGASEMSRLNGFPITMSYYDWLKYPLPTETQVIVYLTFILAFWVKLGLFPLHGWVLSLYKHAPLSLVVFSSALLTKLGAIAWLRWAPAFPQAHFLLGPYIGGLSAISLLGAGLGAYFQKDLRSWLALGTISHLSMIGVGVAATSPTAGNGAAWMMISHALIAALHLLVVSTLIKRSGTDVIAELSGVAKNMPHLAALWMIAALASIGLPGLIQFPAELLILTGTYTSYTLRRGIFIAALIGVLVSAVYTLPVLRRVLFGPSHSSFPDLEPAEKRLLWGLGLLLIGLGFVATPFLNEIQRSIDPLMRLILFQSLGVQK